MELQRLLLAVVLVAGLSIAVVCALLWRWGEWFAKELSTAIFYTSLTVSAFFLHFPSGTLWWEGIALGAWTTGNWIFWGQRRRRLSGATPPAGRPDAAITHWRYISGLGILIWVLGISLVFLQRDSMVGWAGWKVGSYLTLTPPGVAWLAKAFNQVQPGGR